MARYVALLRGINVGTAKAVAMPDLVEVFEALGYSSVKTVLRSGNVVFDAAGVVDPVLLENSIADATGVRAAVVVVASDRFREIAAQNPLLDDVTDPSRAVVTFIDVVPDEAAVTRPSDDQLAPERLVFGRHALYQWCPDGISKSKVPVRFFTTLGSTATARNLRTVDKLLALLDA